MKLSKVMGLFILISPLSSQALEAEDYEYHPILSSDFMLSLGAMRSSNALKLGASSSFDFEDEEFDFDETLAVSDSTTYFNGQLRWNFGRKDKWSVWAQYFSNAETGNVTLEEDIEWDDENGRYVRVEPERKIAPEEQPGTTPAHAKEDH